MSFFDCGMDDTQTFATKLDVLFTWSITSLQYGHHRPFAAIALLDIWRIKQIERAHRRELASPHSFLQDQLFDWLDVSSASRAEGTIDSVALLYGNLIERDLFCYATYLQRLVARGEPGLSLAEV
jgi:mediator of RNA polymerase II transcription subunit 12